MNVLNLKIMGSFPHSLRALSIVTFPPAFVILLLTGLGSHRANPAIGILPHFFSAAYSLLLLANEKRCGCQAAGLTGTPLHMLCDLVCGTGILVCLILGWVFMPQWHYRQEWIMIGTYGTNFLIFNFLVHLYFVARQVLDALQPGSSYLTACPQCKYVSFPSISVTFGDANVDGYAPLLDAEGRPETGGEQEPNNEGVMV